MRCQPSRRSSPTPEPAGQPMNPIRRCPVSISRRVACAVPSALSTSTHECRSGASHGRPNVTNGTPRSASQIVRTSPWSVPVEHEGVEVVRGEQVVVGADLVAVVVGRVEHHPVAGGGGRERQSVQEAVEHRAVDAVAGGFDTHRDQPGTPGAHLPCGLVGPVAEGGDGRPSTRRRVSSRTRCGLLSTLDTVCRDTWARARHRGDRDLLRHCPRTGMYASSAGPIGLERSKSKVHDWIVQVAGLFRTLPPPSRLCQDGADVTGDFVPDRNLQPLLHDLISTVRAPASVLCEPSGQIRAVGVQGMFHADVRVLSRAELLLDGASCRVGGEFSGLVRARRRSSGSPAGSATPDPTRPCGSPGTDGSSPPGSTRPSPSPRPPPQRCRPSCPWWSTPTWRRSHAVKAGRAAAPSRRRPFGPDLVGRRTVGDRDGAPARRWTPTARCAGP